MMKNNKTFLLFLLVAITLIFLGTVIILTMRQPLVNNQASKPAVTVAPTTVAPVTLLLEPQASLAAGQTFTVDLAFSGLTQPIIATDVLLKYDSTMLDFVDTQNIDPHYINPRKLFQNNTLIISLIQKPTSEKLGDFNGTMNLGQLLFRAKKSGTVTLQPVLNSGSRTSLVFVEGNQTNQLGTGNAVDIVIK